MKKQVVSARRKKAGARRREKGAARAVKTPRGAAAGRRLAHGIPKIRRGVLYGFIFFPYAGAKYRPPLCMMR